SPPRSALALHAARREEKAAALWPSCSPCRAPSSFRPPDRKFEPCDPPPAFRRRALSPSGAVPRHDPCEFALGYRAQPSAVSSESGSPDAADRPWAIRACLILWSLVPPETDSQASG